MSDVRNDVTPTILIARMMQLGGDKTSDLTTVTGEDLTPIDAVQEAVMRGLLSSGGRIVIIADPELYMTGDLDLVWDAGRAALIVTRGEAGAALQVRIVKVIIGGKEQQYTQLIITPFKAKQKKEEKKEEEEKDEDEEISEE
ncbi:MAG: hypothetical protein ACP5NY_04170 [Thermocladium sp.]